MTYLQTRKLLLSYSNPKKAEFLKRFFKCGKGEYAEGDVMLGINVPQTRSVAVKAKNLPLKDTAKFLKSKNHEERLLALCILALQFEKGDEVIRKKIFNFYMKNLKHVNNWDLVDSSAPYISGPYLFNRPRGVLFKLARSKKLWEKRVAIISTQHFIREYDFKDTLKICEILLKDDHDLIHKACGWMLREVGKRNLKLEKAFLKKHYKKMPRTMLRYSIEKLPEPERKRYLLGKV